MSDRIVELVKRARRVYGDDAVLDSYEAEGDATFWSVRVGTRVVLHVVGDNALDALEAALLVLSGDAPAWVEQLATLWRSRADEVDGVSEYGRGVATAYRVAADTICNRAAELRERAKGRD